MLYKVHLFLSVSLICFSLSFADPSSEFTAQDISTAIRPSIFPEALTSTLATASTRDSNGQSRPTASAHFADLPTTATTFTSPNNKTATKDSSSTFANSSAPSSNPVTLTGPDANPNKTVAVSHSSALRILGSSQRPSTMLATSFVAALSASLAAATLPSLVTAIPALYTSQPPLVTTQPPVITTLPPIVSLNSAGLPTTLTTSTKATPSPSPSDSSRSKSSSSDEHSTTSSTTRSTKSSSSSSSSSSPSSTRSTTSSTSSSSSSTSSDPTASAGAIPGASNAPAPSGPVPGPASPTNQGPNSASANPSQSSSAAPTPQSSGNHLTGSAIAGISAGSVSGALIVGVAALFLVRRFGRKNAPQEQIYPEEAYLYDPPTTHVIMKPPPVPPAYQIPPMGSYTPFGSNPNLAPAPASDLPRGSFESVDLSAPNPAFVSQGGYAPVGAGDTNSMGGVSAHDWAAENAARTLNPIPAATIAAGAGAGLGIAGAAAYAYRPSEEFDEAHDPAPSISAVGSLPSPVYRVLEEHSQEPRPLHPLERDLGIGRQASVSTLTSEEEQMEENSPLMERTNTQNQHFRPIDELWTGADGYQRVETEDV